MPNVVGRRPCRDKSPKGTFVKPASSCPTQNGWALQAGKRSTTASKMPSMKMGEHPGVQLIPFSPSSAFGRHCSSASPVISASKTSHTVAFCRRKASPASIIQPKLSTKASKIASSVLRSPWMNCSSSTPASCSCFLAASSPRFFNSSIARSGTAKFTTPSARAWLSNHAVRTAASSCALKLDTQSAETCSGT